MFSEVMIMITELCLSYKYYKH